MSAAAVIDPQSPGSLPLRNEPVQARSTARLAALLDAAASVVDEIGYERLTTAMVAEKAGASIGTVYRYFPDRIAVLQALGARNLDRVLRRVHDELVDERHTNWLDALSSSFGVLVEAFRNEAGFRSLRVGDVIDIRPRASERTFNSVVADTLLDGLVSRFGVADTPETRFAFEVALEVSDSLASRAFVFDHSGDQAFLDAGRQYVYAILSQHFGAVENVS
ncbi:TetR/AcrR family transcriptional regulator [Glaciihabitans arcticus]|uniref:TetR/AcrR family transcriptional regulator n=1 Tax=Glaciihabitans arcticus TaxID=2668039 RepID=A0A4Q9GUX7_9MICO|nr:TetR/AcrR family transcriptional regulator [Glaciihabitans arcticus]TBN56997.1 TetR/AcrR family transcriptional regulator [Glaciihabitans arcticus]